MSAAKKRIVIQFIVTARDRQAMRAAAKRHGVSLSAWLRIVAKQAA